MQNSSAEDRDYLLSDSEGPGENVPNTTTFPLNASTYTGFRKGGGLFMGSFSCGGRLSISTEPPDLIEERQ